MVVLRHSWHEISKIQSVQVHVILPAHHAWGIAKMGGNIFLYAINKRMTHKPKPFLNRFIPYSTVGWATTAHLYSTSTHKVTKHTKYSKTISPKKSSAIIRERIPTPTKTHKKAKHMTIMSSRNWDPKKSNPTVSKYIHLPTSTKNPTRKNLPANNGFSRLTNFDK